MISLVFDAARRVIHEHGSVRAAGIGLVAVLLVVFLVAERELLRASGGSDTDSRIRAMAPIILPLLVAFVFIFGARFARVV